MIWKFMRFRNMQTKIQGYGYQYSFSRYLVLLLLGMSAIIAIGKVNGLKPRNIFILIIAMGMLVPLLLLVQFRYLYEQNRFQEIVNYMEQMMYSFQKHPKIISALEEVEGLTQGDLKFRIQQMRKEIESSSQLSYREIFHTIEVEYPCDRLEIMHEFFISVERVGGQYQSALASLIEDLKLFTERTYLFQKERSGMKKKIVLSIACVLGLCAVMFYMMTRNDAMSSVVDSPLYQTGTTLVLLLYLAILGFSQKVLTGSWLEKSKEVSKEEIDKDWNHVKEAPEEYKRAKGRLEKEVEKQFPKWLRIVLLNLQTENVYRSIVESKQDAPYVLQQPLQQLVEEIKEEPTSMKPYRNFLEELALPDVKSSVKMLYAYSNVGMDEAKTQMNALMQRNIILTDRAEKIQNEDKIAKYFILFYIPMFLGTAKIMLDMSLMFTFLFSKWGQFM